MKTGLAVALAALVLSTGCSGNRTEAPAQPAAAAPSQPAEPPAEPAAAPASAPAATETTATTTATIAQTPAAPAAEAATTTPAPPVPAEPVPAAAAPETTPAPAPTETKPQDPLEWMKQREEQRADYQKKLADAEAKVNSGNAAIADWQNMILAFKNPFRPRPQLTPEEAQAIDGKDGVARVSWAEGKLAEATTARDVAQKALDDLKANPPN